MIIFLLIYGSFCREWVDIYDLFINIIKKAKLLRTAFLILSSHVSLSGVFIIIFLLIYGSFCREWVDIYDLFIKIIKKANLLRSAFLFYILFRNFDGPLHHISRISCFNTAPALFHYCVVKS